MTRIITLLSLCTVVLSTSCTHKQEIKAEETPKYAVTSPLQADTVFDKEYVSQIRSVRNIEIRAQEKGYLQNIYVDEGQFVKAGQLLFSIMPKIYEAELLKAEAEAKAAGIEFQNTKHWLKRIWFPKMNRLWRKPSWTRQRPKCRWQNCTFLSQKSVRHLAERSIVFR